MYRYEAERLVESGKGPSDVFELPPTLNLMRQEIVIRTVHLVGDDGLDSVYHRDVGRRFIIEEVLGNIEFHEWLDSLGSGTRTA